MTAAIVLLLGSALLWAQPLPGGPRLPFFLLVAVSLFLVVRQRSALWATPLARELGGALVVLALIIALSLWGAPRPEAGFPYVVGFLGFALASAAVGWAARNFPQASDWWQRGAALTFGFLLADALVQWAVGRDLFGVPYAATEFEGRLVGPFASSLKLPILLPVLFPLAVWRWRAQPAIVLPLLLVTLWVVLLSGSRSGLQLLVLAAIPVVWRWPRALLVGLFVSTIGAVAIIQTFSTPWQVRLHNTDEGLKTLMTETTPDERQKALDQITTYRWELWRNATRMGAAHPFFGVGAKQFSHVYAEFADPGDLYLHDEPFHAHSLYMGLWAELGGAGIAWVVGLAAVMVWRWRRADREAQARAAPWGAALAAYAFPLQSQPVLLNVWWFPVVWFLLVGFWLALETPTNPPPTA
ncbi:hypothetical protein JCM16106_14390 [Hydrogenophilus islandicus]